jgi:hypothetical protein
LQNATFVMDAHTGSKTQREYSSLQLFGRNSGLTFMVQDNIFGRLQIVDYLTKLLFMHNPEPSMGAKEAFTQVLHEYNLHSRFCLIGNKICKMKYRKQLADAKVCLDI